MKLLLAISSTVLITTAFSFAAPPADDILAGPTIVEEEITEKDMLTRHLKESGKTINLSSKVQNRVWLETLRSLELTTEQQRIIGALLQEIRSTQEAFTKEYGQELKELRAANVASRAKDGVATDTDRKRMMELMAIAPSILEYQDRGWDVLTEIQQVEFRAAYKVRLIELQIQQEERKDRKNSSGDNQRGLSPNPPSDSVDKIEKRGRRTFQNDSSVDEASLRRIRFLRRLQNLKSD